MNIELKLTDDEAEMVYEALDLYMVVHDSLNANLIIDIQDKIDAIKEKA